VEVVVTSPLEDRRRIELSEEAEAVELRAEYVSGTVQQVLVGRRQRRIRALALAAAAIVIIVLSGVVLAGQGRDDSSPPVIDRATVQNLRQTERARLTALVEADMPAVQQVLADDFELITPDGTPLPRDAYLGAVASGDLDFKAYQPVTPIETRVYGDAAVLRYKSHIDVVAKGTGHRTDGAWHTCVYENRDGHWQIVWEQTTLVGQLPPEH